MRINQAHLHLVFIFLPLERLSSRFYRHHEMEPTLLFAVVAIAGNLLIQNLIDYLVAREQLIKCKSGLVLMVYFKKMRFAERLLPLDLEFVCNLGCTNDRLALLETKRG